MSSVPREQRGLGDLFGELAAELRLLIRKEIELAKMEIAEGAAALGRNAATIAVGGVLGFAGLLVVLAAIVIGLGHLIGYGWAALLVGIVVLAVAGGLAMSGIKKLKGTHLAPTQAVAEAQETVAQLKESRAWAKRQM
jgi:Putative Actinobacterial Holin-X, holin superfamily III